jgi:hypothetical protein
MPSETIIDYDINKMDQDIDIYQGQDWSWTVIYSDDADVPVDLSGYTAKLEVRESPGGNLLLAMETGGGGITLNASGEIDLVLTDTQTAAIDCTKARYDLKIKQTSDGSITPILKGNFNVTRQITELT